MSRVKCPNPECERDVHDTAFSQFFGCWDCWHRVPHNLRAAHLRAQKTIGLVSGDTQATKNAIREWWTENSLADTEPKEPEPPAWRRFNYRRT